MPSLILGLVLGLGCSPTLHVRSQPIGAVIEMSDGERVVTPTIIKSTVWPLRRPEVTVSASGYRAVTLRTPYVGRDPWVIVLIPEHGPAVLGMKLNYRSRSCSDVTEVAL